MASYRGDVIRSGFQTSEDNKRLQGVLGLFEIATEKKSGNEVSEHLHYSNENSTGFRFFEITRGSEGR